MRTSDGTYTNLALMLSDQCPWTCVVRSSGTAEEVVNGSILDQLQNTEKVVLAMRQRIAREANVEMPKLPGLAFAEILLNAVSHRSYCSHEPIVVDVSLDNVAVTSPGGVLRTGIRYVDRTRNPKLAYLLEFLGFKNAGIRGIGGIRRSYRNC